LGADRRRSVAFASITYMFYYYKVGINCN